MKGAGWRIGDLGHFLTTQPLDKVLFMLSFHFTDLFSWDVREMNEKTREGSWGTRIEPIRNEIGEARIVQLGVNGRSKRECSIVVSATVVADLKFARIIVNQLSARTSPV
jgi:hypothetical protein